MHLLFVCFFSLHSDILINHTQINWLISLWYDKVVLRFYSITKLGQKPHVLLSPLISENKGPFDMLFFFLPVIINCALYTEERERSDEKKERQQTPFRSRIQRSEGNWNILLPASSVLSALSFLCHFPLCYFLSQACGQCHSFTPTGERSFTMDLCPQ